MAGRGRFCRPRLDPRRIEPGSKKSAKADFFDLAAKMVGQVIFGPGQALLWSFLTGPELAGSK